MSKMNPEIVHKLLNQTPDSVEENGDYLYEVYEKVTTANSIMLTNRMDDFPSSSVYVLKEIGMDETLGGLYQKLSLTYQKIKAIQILKKE
jgi:hypothetical protein